jgi:hypothetical protein
VLRGGGTLTIATTMLDHAGDWDPRNDLTAPVQLAGLSRLLAANDWQTREVLGSDYSRAGTAKDRNVLLTLADPW